MANPCSILILCKRWRKTQHYYYLKCWFHKNDESTKLNNALKFYPRSLTILETISKYDECYVTPIFEDSVYVYLK